MKRLAAVFFLGLLCAACSGKAKGDKKLKVGYVLHGLNDFTQVIKRGAEDAGRDLDVDVEVTGPVGFVSTDAIGMFEAMTQKRKDGLVVIPQPGAVWVVPIRQAVDAGIPVVTANVTSVESPAAAWFGQDEYQSGVILGTELRKQLAAAGKTEGKVVDGICLSGIRVLVDRHNGLKKALEGTGFTVVGPFDVTVENTANYGAWENLASAHKDMVAAVGLCSLDLPNLAKLKKRTGAKWLLAGYDLNLETLDAIKDGTAQVTVGQHPYLQGYLPVRALVEHLRDGKPLVKGWVDVGTEVVTKENVAELYDREAKTDVARRWYADHCAKQFPDLATAAKPLPGKR